MWKTKLSRGTSSFNIGTLIYNSHNDIQVWIENIWVLDHSGDLILATYEERQENESKTTTRLSSVLFRQVHTIRYGLLWLHVYETWVDP